MNDKVVEWVGSRKIFFPPPTKKPVGWETDGQGRRRRVYDEPKTPYQRLLESGVLSTRASVTGAVCKLNPVS